MSKLTVDKQKKYLVFLQRSRRKAVIAMWGALLTAVCLILLTYLSKLDFIQFEEERQQDQNKDNGIILMNLLPREFVPLILLFAPLFSKPVWESAIVLLVGAIVAPGKRTVSAILRVMGLSQAPHFQNYHRVLNRAVWSSLKASRILLLHLIAVFAPTGPLVMGIDDTYAFGGA